MKSWEKTPLSNKAQTHFAPGLRNLFKNVVPVYFLPGPVSFYHPSSICNQPNGFAGTAAKAGALSVHEPKKKKKKKSGRVLHISAAALSISLSRPYYYFDQIMRFMSDIHWLAPIRIGCGLAPRYERTSDCISGAEEAIRLIFPLPLGNIFGIAASILIFSYKWRCLIYLKRRAGFRFIVHDLSRHRADPI